MEAALYSIKMSIRKRWTDSFVVRNENISSMASSIIRYELSLKRRHKLNALKSGTVSIPPRKRKVQRNFPISFVVYNWEAHRSYVQATATCCGEKFARKYRSLSRLQLSCCQFFPVALTPRGSYSDATHCLPKRFLVNDGDSPYRYKGAAGCR